MTIDIVFDGPPGPEPGRFVEVENEDGESISIGEWVERNDGYWVLRIEQGNPVTAIRQDAREEVEEELRDMDMDMAADVVRGLNIGDALADPGDGGEG